MYVHKDHRTAGIDEVSDVSIDTTRSVHLSWWRRLTKQRNHLKEIAK